MSNDGRRVAVVVGASSGIGRATAELLRKQNVTTIGISRRLEDTDSTRRCDVRNEQSVERVIKNILSTFGRIDILVNCAGIASLGGPLTLTADEWEDVLKTNLIGSYFCCKHVIPPMRAQSYGRVVNVSSIAGRAYSRTASVAYTCSKYAVIGLTRQLGGIYGKDGITINCVCPTHTKSEMLLANMTLPQLNELAASNPLGRLAEPHEVAEVICFLAGDSASYVNGAVVDINGGLL